MIFQRVSAKVTIGFSSYVKIFQNAAFRHVDEVPISGFVQSDREFQINSRNL